MGEAVRGRLFVSEGRVRSLTDPYDTLVDAVALSLFYPLISFLQGSTFVLVSVRLFPGQTHETWGY